jgi:pimeloyl-ACP methyl ester carboxylesterase
MYRVMSKDGTPIAYGRQGSGPAIILVTGALDDGAENARLATALAEHFTVFNYNRRGRGRSGDTSPYAVDRELEDLAALIAEAGGSAQVYGVSSGGMLALEAAMAGLAIDRLAIYEAPYDVAADAPQRFREYSEQLAAALADGRRGDAVELFMRLAGSSDDDIAGARSSAHWPGVEALAHTLAYDAALYGQPPNARLATIRQPTLVATGGGTDLFEQAADAIATSVPRAERLTLEGQGHVVDPKALAPVLTRFFAHR